MQDPQTYIQERLNRLTAKADTPVFKNEDDLVAYISRSLLSKKFRKYAVDAALLEHLPKALRLNIEKREPIKLAMPFGGYKLWRLAEAPEADWAELFTLMYYAAWLKPIADVYEPGVWFDFSSDDVVIERLNNIPKADTEAYIQSFNAVITFLEKYIPSTIRFTLTPVGSRYTDDEFAADLEDNIQALLAAHNGVPPTPSPAEIAMMDLNAHWPDEVRSALNWHAHNKLMHDAYMNVSKRRSYYRTPDKLLAFTKSLPCGIAVGTTKTSIAKFWAGVGALKKRGKKYIETVLSPEQIQAAEMQWIDIHLPGLVGKNFKKIRIID